MAHPMPLAVQESTRCQLSHNIVAWTFAALFAPEGNAVGSRAN